MRVRPKVANLKMAAERDGTTSGRFWTLFYATRTLSNFVLGRVLFELWSTKCPKIDHFREKFFAHNFFSVSHKDLSTAPLTCLVEFYRMVWSNVQKVDK